MQHSGHLLVALAAAVAVGMLPGVASAQTSLDALIKAAKAEGEVTFYSTETEGIAKRLSEGYSKKYGIRSSFIRLASSPLQQRYAAEADSGNIAADLFFNPGTADGFAADAIKKGWMESIADAGLPVVLSGEYPGRLAKAQSALVKISPSHIIYNTEKVKTSDIPKDWPDLLNPKFKGQVILPDPAASDANLAFWYLVMNTFGESYLQKLNAQIGRRFVSGVPAIQSLAAGEGMIMAPIAYGAVIPLIQKGAPLDGIIPVTSTGVETHVILTARAKAKHPNAGRLLASYVMSREGNNVFVGGERGAFGVYDLDKLPKTYQTSPMGVSAHREKIRKLLGF